MPFSESVRGERPSFRQVRTRVVLVTLVCSSLVSIGGCSTSATINGTVTYDGPPVAYGSIAFEPKDTKQKKVVATIDDGKFQANDVAAGPTVIRICVGERPKGQAGSLVNSAPSGTLVEISKSEKSISGGAQTLKFNLKGR